MFDGGDIAYVKRAINQNQVVLFLGAGFSTDAINLAGSRLPSSPELCRILWKLLGYTGTWDETPLQILFDSALRRDKRRLEEIMQQNLLVKEAPSWYDFLGKAFWHRIYTTNVDNLVEEVFRRAAMPIRKLAVVSATTQDYEDRDQFLHTIQYVKLHGSLPGAVEKLTFSRGQYATRSAVVHDVWYDHFVRDYATHPTIFVGTVLNEPLFHQYLAVREGRLSREGRALDFPERRLKSYLISEKISEPVKDNLKELNIVSVEATARDFFTFLFEHIQPLSSRLDVLKLRHPDLSAVLSETREVLTTAQAEALEDFYGSFHRVPDLTPRPEHTKNYLLGYSPTWQDLANNLDAPREISEALINSAHSVLEKAGLQVLSVIGSAGSGKSTVLMRVGKHLHQEGHTVFFTHGWSLPSGYHIRDAMNLVPGRAILIIDNAEISAPLMPSILEALKAAERPPVILLASQANMYDRLERRLAPDTEPLIIAVPNLSPADIDNVLTVLRETGLLGRLQGMNDDQRRHEFKIRARSQILVAMREATRGEGFDYIIQQEYANVEPENARILLLCVSLASCENLPLTREQFIACSESTDFETLGYLDRNLRDVVVADPFHPDNLFARHSLIAKQVVEQCAPKTELCEAYVRLLLTLSHDFDPQRPRRSRGYRLYQLIINHRSIYERFEMAIDSARKIYESIKSQLERDWQFWLQYGSLELEYGQLSLAENYLDQAFALKPDHDFITHARAHLWLKQANVSASISEALRLREQAERLLVQQFEREDLNDPYPYHILCSQTLVWIRTWVTKPQQKKKELEALKEYIREGRERFPWNKRIEQLEEDIHREYLMIAVR
jgi:tetratricopeptide (TPR) repeat protein